MPKPTLPSWPELNAVLHRNLVTYPVLLDELAVDLSVGTSSLVRLEAGFAPFVEFTKKGTRETFHAGPWWTFPGRNERGEVIGVFLRKALDGKAGKAMWPGSGMGLIYPVPEGFDPASGGTLPDFRRVSELGTACPKCGKDDWCMVAGDPEDPSAAICGRVSEGSLRRTADGQSYVHVLKPSAIRKVPPLAEHELLVLVLEGASDVAAALDLGLLAVGRPNDKGGLTAAAELLRGRDVVVVGENDKKANGDWPGRDGMDTAAKMLADAAASVKTCMPPPTCKDLRQWVRDHGPSAADILDQASDPATGDILPTTEFNQLCKHWLSECHSDGSNTLLLRRDGAFYDFDFDRGCYTEVHKDEYVWASLQRFLDGKRHVVSTPKGDSVEPYELDTYKLNNILNMTRGNCSAGSDPPCWLSPGPHPATRDMIVFRNGILDVRSFIDGDYQLRPPSPDYFTTVAIPHNFNPDAYDQLDTLWAYTDSSLKDDPAKFALSQEWAGYLLSSDTSMQKFMYVIGPPRAGKGIYISLLEHMVGEKQRAATNYHALAKDYGTAKLVDTLVATMPDAHDVPKGVAGQHVLEILKSVTGEDTIDINRKHLPAISRKLLSRFTIASNHIPAFPDEASALRDRLLILPFTESFRGREDRNLREKLFGEIEGIIIWALHGLVRLRKQGHFTETKNAERMKDTFQRQASSVAAFVIERCAVEPGLKTTRTRLYSEYVAWAQHNGIDEPRQRSQFATEIRNTNPNITVLGEAIQGIGLRPL
ncbi:MAG: phage/plasmid primase, P4 family [Planctomycetota bacterium]